jgi:hypothetical protein
MTSLMAPTQPKTNSEMDHDLIVRSAPMQPSGLDESSRSISCVLSTETPVRMYDWNNGGYIDEVLRADGGQMPSQLPLLDNHSRYSSLDVVGSARDIKSANGQVIGRVYFAQNVDRADTIYELVRQGHLTDVSVGYRYGVGDYIDIQRGQSAKIGTKSYTASADRTMRVVTRWGAKELSVTPIGADQLAKMRSLSDSKFGHEVSNREIGSQSQTREIESSNNDRQEPKMSAVATESKTTPAVEQTRSEQLIAQVATPLVAVKDEATIRSEAQREERERAEYARSFAGRVRTELIDESVKEGWPKEKMNERFLTSITSERTTPVAVNKSVGIHVHDNEIRKEDIQALFLSRAGVKIEGGHFAKSECHQATFERREGHEQDMSFAIRAARTLERGGNLDETSERALEFANKHRNVSMVDICSMALDLAGIAYNRYDDREIITRAVTTQSVAAFMSNALGAQILDAFVGSPDTTGWCRSVDLPNDNPQPVAKGGMMSRLKKRLSGQVPVPATRDATEEFISVATYSEQYFVDRKDLLADRFGKINDGPADIGMAAMEIIQDLVYSALLINANMADGNALFSAAHGNSAVSAALSGATLFARQTAMMVQTNNGRPISADPYTLIIPPSLAYTAKQIMQSTEVRNGTTVASDIGTANPMQGTFNLVIERRIETGTINPDTDLAVAARALDYYIADRQGRWGLLKAFLRSNGGGPVIEQWMPGDGRIGIGTTVELEAGIKAVGWEGLQRGTGAGS